MIWSNMLNDRPTIKHAWQYALVFGVIALMSYLEILFPDLRDGLIATPYLIIVLVSSIFFDLVAGMLSVVVGTAGVFLIRYMPYGYSANVVTGTIEFVLAGAAIYLLAKQSRTLIIKQLNLEQTVKQMERATKRLKTEVNVKKKDLDRLNRINNDADHFS